MTPSDETVELTTATVHPLFKFKRYTPPVLLIHTFPESGSPEASGAQIECKIDDSGKPLFRFYGEDWAEIQSLSHSDLEIILQVMLGYSIGDPRVIAFAEMSIANRPVTSRT